MRNPLISLDLQLCLQAGEEDVVREFLEEHEPPTAAELIEDLGEPGSTQMLALLDPRMRAQVFSYFEPRVQRGMITAMPVERAAELLHLMPHDDRVDLVKRLDDVVEESILRKLAHAEREDIRRLASYEEGTAGAVMTTDYATLTPLLSVREALDQLRREAPDRETIDPSYVIDHHRKLLGVISLKTLVLSRASLHVEEIMTETVVSGQVDERMEEAARKIAKYDLLALPVVDGEGKMLGIITHDDALDILRREQADNLLAITGVTGEEDDDPNDGYWRGRLHDIVRRRLWCLSLLFFSGFFTTLVQGWFNGLGTELLLILTPFVPLLVGTGGNAGSQTVGTIIHGMALGEITPADAYRVLLKEWLNGCVLGAFLGFVGVGFALVQGKSLGVAVVVGLAVWAICMWANSVAAVVPLMARRFRIDPALISAPLISTLVDITGLLIYFGLAALLLRGLVMGT